MPVLIIAAAYGLLFRGAESGEETSRASFLDPSGLRDRLAERLPEGDTRDAALALADELAQVASSYAATMRASLERYAAHTDSGEFTTASILELLAPSDRAGREALHAVVRIRQALLETLPEESWREVFG